MLPELDSRAIYVFKVKSAELMMVPERKRGDLLYILRFFKFSFKNVILQKPWEKKLLKLVVN